MAITRAIWFAIQETSLSRMTSTTKKSAEALARNRDAQRRSRQNRARYIKALECQIHEQGSVEISSAMMIQGAARRVANQNVFLKERIMRLCGIDLHELEFVMQLDSISADVYLNRRYQSVVQLADMSKEACLPRSLTEEPGNTIDSIKALASFNTIASCAGDLDISAGSFCALFAQLSAKNELLSGQLSINCSDAFSKLANLLADHSSILAIFEKADSFSFIKDGVIVVRSQSIDEIAFELEQHECREYTNAGMCCSWSGSTVMRLHCSIAFEFCYLWSVNSAIFGQKVYTQNWELKAWCKLIKSAK